MMRKQAGAQHFAGVKLIVPVASKLESLRFSTSSWTSLASTACPPLHAQGEEAGGELSFLIEPKLDGERQQVRTAWRRRHDMARCTKCADCSRASLPNMLPAAANARGSTR